DGDGQCDPCDYCPFRFGTSCFCGDNVVDPPSEECDLGGLNGQSGQPCSAGCQVQGACLGGASSGVDCTEDVDCPGGTCCGNAEPTPPEECDDGNQITDDTCSNSCQFTPAGVPILGCEDVFGPNLIPAFVKVAKFTDTDNDNPHVYDKWKTKGD